jgi:hypothetical protein
MQISAECIGANEELQRSLYGRVWDKRLSKRRMQRIFGLRTMKVEAMDRI